MQVPHHPTFKRGEVVSNLGLLFHQKSRVFSTTPFILINSTCKLVNIRSMVVLDFKFDRVEVVINCFNKY